jgi:hypothetical protein
MGFGRCLYFVRGLRNPPLESRYSIACCLFIKI